MAGLEQSGFVERGDGVRLAWSLVPGRGPVVVFLGGYASDMTGAKALFLRDWAVRTGRAFLRLDVSGHGASGGAFTDGTIGVWMEDARLVIAGCTDGEVVLVGSSMGGWIALLLARAVPLAGLVGVAAAPDFTEELMWAAMAPPERAALMRDGVLRVPSAYGPDLAVTRGLIEDGRRHLVLTGGPIAVGAPVRLLHGQRDSEVPWETALRIAERVVDGDVQTVLVKDGDHRLSRPGDLALLGRTLELLLEGGA